MPVDGPLGACGGLCRVGSHDRMRAAGIFYAFVRYTGPQGLYGAVEHRWRGAAAAVELKENSRFQGRLPCSKPHGDCHCLPSQYQVSTGPWICLQRALDREWRLLCNVTLEGSASHLLDADAAFYYSSTRDKSNNPTLLQTRVSCFYSPYDCYVADHCLPGKPFKRLLILSTLTFS